MTRMMIVTVPIDETSWSPRGATEVAAAPQRARAAEPILLPAPVKPVAVVATPAPRRGRFYRRAGKRACDVLLVLLAAPIVLPLILILAALVRRDGGPAFFVQERVGAGGRIFRMWKLRSMSIDAEARLEELLAKDVKARMEWNRTQKLRRDPRITRVGHLIRKSSLDELPQLLNVLKGEMSLVGPRPMLPQQQEIYPGKNYYHLRPGLTGNWQVSSRNDSSFAERARYDRIYDETLSLRTDLSVMLATVRVIVKATGF